MDFLPITSMSNMVPGLTNVRYPLNVLNRLTVCHTVTPSRDNTHSIRIKFTVWNTLMQMDDIVIAFRNGPILSLFKNRIRKAQHACLSTLKSSIQ